MSPEQARGEALTSASDVFSFGLVLYEVSTGVHPFAEHFPGGVLEAVINKPALAPNVVVDTLPPALDSLLLQMLEKSPAARPTADQVLASLEGLDRSAGEAEPIQQRPRRQRSLIGRDTELATLHSALRAVREGT
jgi:serine/threonine-protein kinase